jgi:hypothetical protein
MLAFISVQAQIQFPSPSRQNSSSCCQKPSRPRFCMLMTKEGCSFTVLLQQTELNERLESAWEMVELMNTQHSSSADKTSWVLSDFPD